MSGAGWIGVDLDGTLAHYEGWNGGAIGKPIKPMMERVRAWLAKGTEVRIVTARVSNSGRRNDVGGVDDEIFANVQRALIQDWCAQHLGVVLEVTATKDFQMIELWDDRAVQVELNTGVQLSPGRAR